MTAKTIPTGRRAKARVFLLDDHPLLRKGIADCIRDEPDLTVCGQAGSTAEALPAIAREKPDVVIVDISLPGRDGLELIKELKVQQRNLPVLVLSMHDESLYAPRALRAGARGYVMKSAPTGELIAAIRRVLAGEIVVGQNVINQILAPGGKVSPVECLTDREMEIFRLLGQGRQRAQIAAQLKLSVKTIETHRDHMRQKLGLPNAAALLQHAIEFIRDEAAG